MQRGLLTVNERIRTQLIGMGRRKHQRLDGDRNDFGDAQAFADIDVIQIADFDAVDRDDIARHLELIPENAAERLGDVEVQGQIKRTFRIVGVFENLRHAFGDAPYRLIIRHAAHGQRQRQAGRETGQIELTQRLLQRFADRFAVANRRLNHLQDHGPAALFRWKRSWCCRSLGSCIRRRR